MARGEHEGEWVGPPAGWPSHLQYEWLYPSDDPFGEPYDLTVPSARPRPGTDMGSSSPRDRFPAANTVPTGRSVVEAHVPVGAWAPSAPVSQEPAAPQLPSDS